MFPYVFFPNALLPRQLYFIINDNSSLAGAAQTIVIFQVFLLLFTTLRSIYSVVKRDNVLESVILMMFPFVGIFTVCLMETLLLSGFLGNPDFDPEPVTRLLSSPWYCAQIIFQALIFAAAAAYYERMNHRLNGKWPHPLLFLCLYAVETVSVLVSLAAGILGMMGHLQWLDSVPAFLLNWYIYGLNLLFTKSFVFAAAIVLGLSFASPGAKRKLRGSPPDELKNRERERQAGPRSAVEAHARVSLQGAAESGVKHYIRSKSMPYFIGLGSFGFGAAGSLIGIEYRQYVQKTFYHPGDLPFSIAAGIFFIGFICAMGWIQDMIGVLFPGKFGEYKRLADDCPDGRTIQLFYREFILGRPVFSAGKLTNVMLTHSFIVWQSMWLRIVPICSIQGIQLRVTAGGGSQQVLILRLSRGKPVKIVVPAGYGNYIRSYLLDRMDEMNGVSHYQEESEEENESAKGRRELSPAVKRYTAHKKKAR